MSTQSILSGSIVSFFYSWWRGDPLPGLPALAGLEIMPDRQAQLAQQYSGITAIEAGARIRQGNRAFVARVDGQPAGFGWSAAGDVSIGEFDLDVRVPPGNRYLWDFVTLPAWRGRGIYPLILQAILTQEVDAARFWIGHDLGNVASARGIAKAGFQIVGGVRRGSAAQPLFVPGSGPAVERAGSAATLLGMPLSVHGRTIHAR